ncbi:hypothetical protein HYPSUDRAFT_43067 [Hypholoma sublateritium FD-334 SS-4]|uniref:Uncharacterized protein n=1 Tax=Hypholoma sublateritium (strain FD-334 SS-4) TaxID=945553 RepID=A0A0D2NVL7_HYPSF|nr:hypothetical protein HYPSUDRAFT_43067 [Hypholoma sublateritium FD-334 SS-4]
MDSRNDPHNLRLDIGVEKGAETDPAIDPSVTLPPLNFPEPEEVSRFTKQEKWLIVIFTVVIA